MQKITSKKSSARARTLHTGLVQIQLKEATPGSGISSAAKCKQDLMAQPISLTLKKLRQGSIKFEPS